MTLIVLLFLSCLCFVVPEKPQWFINDLVSWLVFPAALGGTLFICTFLMCTEKILPLFVKMILKYIGRNTYIIIAFHQITLQLVSFSGLMSNGSFKRISMWIILILIIEFVNRKCPQILGK